MIKFSVFIKAILIAFIVQLISSQQLRINYGLYLGNVTFDSIRYDWKVNFILNGNYDRPILPPNITSS
jgi:hypothetical protein